jgi:hypothetical protein
MKETSDQNKKKINHFLLIKGLPMEDIAPLVGVVLSTVSKVAGELAAELGQETYDLLRNDAVQRRKKEITLEASIQGAKVIDAVGEYGIEKAEDYVVNVIVASNGFSVPAEEMASKIKDMVEIGKKYKVAAVDAPALAEQKEKELEITLQRISDARATNKRESESFQKDMEARSQNQLTLAIFDEACKKLGNDGPAKISMVARFSERIVKPGLSEADVVRICGAVLSPEKQVKRLELEAKRLEPIAKKWKENDALHRIIEDGIPSSDMKSRILYKLQSDANKSWTDPAQVVSQMFLNYLFTDGIPTPGPVVRVFLPTMPAETVVKVEKKPEIIVKHSGVVQFGSGHTSIGTVSSSGYVPGNDAH